MKKALIIKIIQELQVNPSDPREKKYLVAATILSTQLVISHH